MRLLPVNRKWMPSAQPRWGKRQATAMVEKRLSSAVKEEWKRPKCAFRRLSIHTLAHVSACINACRHLCRHHNNSLQLWRNCNTMTTLLMIIMSSDVVVGYCRYYWWLRWRWLNVLLVFLLLPSQSAEVPSMRASDCHDCLSMYLKWYS